MNNTTAVTARLRLWHRVVAGNQGRALSGLLLVFLFALSFAQRSPLIDVPRLALFDSYQKLFPRERRSAPAVIVAIDEASLKAHGQWPWPRTLIAQLVHAIARARPAALGIDILFAEPDRLSANSIAANLPGMTDELRRRLARVADNDSVLATALAEAPVVLGFAGIDEPHPNMGDKGTPAPFILRGNGAPDRLASFGSSLRSLAALQRTAHGQGLISASLHDGRVRRVPLLAKTADILAPALALEMLRVAIGASFYSLDRYPSAVRVGELSIPLSPEGEAWIYFTPHDPDRFISASDVLTGRVTASQLEGKLVLLGVTAIGLLDQQTSAIGERMPGVEIHAQLLENIFDDQLPRRPDWAMFAERTALLALGVLLVIAIPQLRPTAAGWLFGVSVSALLAAGFVLFRFNLLLFDAATPALTASMLFAVLITGKLADIDRHRRYLQQEQTRAAAEMASARRIQMGLLPAQTGELHADRRFSISAVMEPAREVGGDFYDFFKLSDHQLIALVGDVSGKGLPASLFMAITKALYKSAALRGGLDLGLLMSTAQREIARDNPEMLFVTVLAVLLDLRTGELQYCSAGHDAPFCITTSGQQRLAPSGGPPLCVLDDFAYTSALHQMQPAETLCVVTDGVTEAANTERQLYGSQRLAKLLGSIASVQEPAQLVTAVHDDVRKFEAGTERSDDLTILALRWNGPSDKPLPA